jgi:hypothetical protein
LAIFTAILRASSLLSNLLPISARLFLEIDIGKLLPGAERVQGGYKVNTGRWAGYDPFFVEWDRALPFSPDGIYHICITSDETGTPNLRCLIVPPSSA